ncbi:sulfite reductase subunit alpha [Pseudomonas sp.]|uniref:sulfite reductase subunit alpha n=1 Tax=Pseudomonas sp. TaxID=306 RepID=UPI0028A6B5D2|nr:sulfite reductase subunit alpha [Pseudomonas sp.]
MARRSSLARLAPLLACLPLAVASLGWQPSRALSAALVVLAYLGLCLHSWHDARQRRLPLARQTTDGLLIAYASQGGQARSLAERSVVQLQAAGMAAEARALNTLDPTWLMTQRRVLFIVSTYGEGEPPDNAAHFARRLSRFDGDLSALAFALLALGDSHYPRFCGFGRQLDGRLRQLGAQPLFDRLEADRTEPGMLRHWQQQLAHLSGHSDFSDWQPVAYQHWRLDQREWLNPGSPGAPVYRLRLRPPAGRPAWQAGDIAEIGPRHPQALVERRLREAGFDPHQHDEPGHSLAAELASRRLPPGPDGLRGLDLAALLALPPLPHREYSIASVPAEGCIELLVRETRHADGQLGLGSGWLCRHAPLGSAIDLRVRDNPGFHGPGAEVPLILIGNGTGLAGLRAHLQARAATPGSRNWLLFGERSAAHDQWLDEQLQRWRQSGHLQRLDLAFSRDGAQKVYVQHCLRDAADEVRRWIAEGAAIYVCGSLDGMGRDVHQMLVGLLGEAQLQALGERGRYRRDLY